MYHTNNKMATREEMGLLEENLQKAKDYDYVRFTFADIHGIPRCRIIPKRSLERMFYSGIGMWPGCLFLGASGETLIDVYTDELPNLSNRQCANALLCAQSGTLTPVPWATVADEQMVGQLLCEFQWSQTGLPINECTRYMARRQIMRVEELGYKLFSGFEIEFMLMDIKKHTPIFQGYDYARNDTWNTYEGFLLAVDSTLQKMGVELESHQIEGGRGQFESATAPRFGIQSADDVFIFKDACREIARQRDDDVEAIFMTAPDPTNYSNGLHFSLSLLDEDGLNVLHNKEDGDKLSSVARHWLGGLIKHAGAVTALTSPTVNCYRRLHKPWTPRQANWGIDHRQTAFRVKSSNPLNTIIECRIPACSANPYIIVAAILAAGMDGIVNKIQCPPQEDPEAVTLPTDLNEALGYLKNDDVIADALGREFIDVFCLLKKKYEIAVLNNATKECDIKDREWNMYRKF